MNRQPKSRFLSHAAASRRLSEPMKCAPAALIVAAAGLLSFTVSAADALKTERFDRDPGWDVQCNRIVPKKFPVVKQDFGYSATNFAGAGAGEVGGKITRTTRPASYAAKLSPKTLDDRLSTAGSFAIKEVRPSSGVFFGWFNAQQPGGSGRSIDSACSHRRRAASSCASTSMISATPQHPCSKRHANL